TGTLFRTLSRGNRIEHLANVDDLAADGRRSHHGRAHEQRAPRRTALASLEVAIRRGRRHLTSFEAIRIHAETHRAAGAAPLEARVDERLVQASRFGRAADRLRPGHDERL